MAQSAGFFPKITEQIGVLDLSKFEVIFCPRNGGEKEKLEFRKMVALAKFSFEKAKSITYERNKLFAEIQEAGESLKSLHAALTAQAAKAELGTIEDELVRDLFISKMKNSSARYVDF